MGKKSSVTDTTMLRLEILRRIPEKRAVTARELERALNGEGFTQSERTIQRHLDEISKDKSLGIVQDKRSKPYGYHRSVKAAGFQVTNISAQEAILFRLAEIYLENILPSSLKQSMKSFFEQAQRNLCYDENIRYEKEWIKKVFVMGGAYPLLPPTIKEGVLNEVTEALYKNCYLYLEYINAKGEHTNTHVMPLGLGQQENRLYLVARYEGNSIDRTFALHRIQYCHSTLRTFERPADFDIQQYAAEGRFYFGEGRRIHLTFCINKVSGQHLQETPLSNDQKIEVLSADVLRITATVVDSLFFKRWLQGFGGNVWDIRKENVG